MEDTVSIVLYLGIGLLSGSMISQARRMQSDARLVRQRGIEENKQQLYDLFKQLPIPVSVLSGPDYRFEFINPLTQQIIGKREIQGQSIREALPEYGSQGIFDLLDKVYTSGEPLTIQQLRAETLHYEQDGLPVPIERYYSVVYQPLRTELGGVDGIIIFNIDITEQVLADQQKERLMMQLEQERDHLRSVLAREQELRQTAETVTRQLQTVLEVLPVGVTITDANGRIVQRNAATLQIWGEPLSDPKGLGEYQSDMGTWAETGKPVLAAEWPLARALMKGEISHNKEIDVSLKGERKTLLYFAAPMRNEQGEIMGGVAAGLDITERKRLELRLRQAEQQTRESLQALLVLAEALVSAPIAEIPETSDPASALSDVSQRLLHLIRSVLNCKRISITVLDPLTNEPRSLAVVGLPPEMERLWKERRPGFYLSDQIAGASLAAQFSAGDVVVIDMRDPAFTGKPNPFEIKTMLLAPMHVGTRLIGILSLDYGGDEHEFSDGEKSLTKAIAELAALILERERLLTERARSHANVLALQEANRLKDEFIGIASHELRTPLTTVKASVQLINRQVARLLQLETTLSPEALKLITTMQNLLQRAERQVGIQNRLVNDLLDISRIETGRLELHPELCDLVALVREATEDQQALTPARQILFEQNLFEEALVLVDPDRLRQVITNYLSNALKYSASDQSVSVRIALLETRVLLEVEDKGPGLTEDQQEHIWNRFYRVPGIEVKSGSGVGLGLGLYISRMIIERHNGHVGVRSTKGQGSIFWLALPRAE